MTRERTLNRLAGAIRDASHSVVREEVRHPQRAVVRTTDPLRVELTNARLVLEDEDLIMSQEVRRYDYDFGIVVGDTVVLLPVTGEEWVISNVISQSEPVLSALALTDLRVTGKLKLSAGEHQYLTHRLDGGQESIVVSTDPGSWPYIIVQNDAFTGVGGAGIAFYPNARPSYVKGYELFTEADIDGLVVYSKEYADTALVLSHRINGVPNQRGIQFGMGAGYVTLYQVAANVLKTDGALQTGGEIAALGRAIRSYANTSAEIGLGNNAGVPIILFGSAQDVNLYRAAADVLQTDDAFIVGGSLQVVGSLNTGTFVNLPNAGVINFGSDVDLLRVFTDTLATHDDFIAREGSASRVFIGAIPGGAGLAFGSAVDTNLYRAAANLLKTDDSLEVAGGLVVGAGVTVGGGLAVAPGASRPGLGDRHKTWQTPYNASSQKALISRVSARAADWAGMHVEVIVRTDNWGGGSYCRAVLRDFAYATYGAGNYGLEVIESIGAQAVAPKLGPPVLVSGSTYEHEIYLDVPPYIQCYVEVVTANTAEVARPFPGPGCIDYPFSATTVGGTPAFASWVGPPKYVTVAEFAALTPVDGMEVYLRVDDANGVLWHFRYNAASASAYKWEFLGGPPFVHDIATEEATASTTPVDLTTPGPDFTAPRAGDYSCQWGCTVSSGVTILAATMGLSVGGATPVGALQGVAAGQWASMTLGRRFNGVAAATLIRAKYNNAVGTGTGSYRDRWLRVTPVRVS